MITKQQIEAANKQLISELKNGTFKYPAYVKDTSGELWWCNSHGRRATHILVKADHPSNGQRCCAPGQGGILLPCRAVNLTGICVIEDERGNPI